MELLPDEKILRYLNHFKLRNCLRVCQKWHRVARDNFLWHEIEVSWKKPLNDRVILSTIAHQHPSVHTLVIASHSNTYSRPSLPCRSEGLHVFGIALKASQHCQHTKLQLHFSRYFQVYSVPVIVH